MAVPTGRAMARPPGPTTAVAIGLLAATPPVPKGNDLEGVITPLHKESCSSQDY